MYNDGVSLLGLYGPLPLGNWGFFYCNNVTTRMGIGVHDLSVAHKEKLVPSRVGKAAVPESGLLVT